MVNVSCLATINMHKAFECEQDVEAYSEVRKRLKAAAMQVALDLRRDGFDVDLDVVYSVAIKSARKTDPPESP